MSAGLTFISCGLMVVPSTALNSQSQSHGLWVGEVGQLRLNGINRPTSPPHFYSTFDWWNGRRNVGLVSQKCGLFYGWPIIKEKEKWPVNRGTYFTSHGWLFSFSYSFSLWKKCPRPRHFFSRKRDSRKHTTYPRQLPKERKDQGAVVNLNAVLNAAYIFWNYGGMVTLVTSIPPSKR